MRISIAIGLIVLISTSGFCQQPVKPTVIPVETNDESSDFPAFLSLVRLMATPERFDGKVVIVFGWVRIALEEEALYLSRESMILSRGPDAIWLRFTEKFLKTTNPKVLDGYYMMLKGTFHKDWNGHMHMCAGGIAVEEVWYLDASAAGGPKVPTPTPDIQPSKKE